MDCTLNHNASVPVDAARRGRFDVVVVVVVEHITTTTGADDVAGVVGDAATVDGAAALVAVRTNHTPLRQVAGGQGARDCALLVVHEILRQGAVGRLDLYLQLL